MYTLFIDDSGSLHPNHQNDFLIIAGFLIPTRDLKRLKNIVRKVISKTGKSELKSSDIDIYFPKLIHKINLIWPKPHRSDCKFVYLNKKGVYKDAKEFSLKKENEIRAKAISILTRQFLDSTNNVLDVIFDEFFSNKDCEMIKSLLDEKYKFRDNLKYDYDSSNKTPGLKVAHCIANIFLRFKEKNIKLVPYIKDSLKKYHFEMEQSMKEIKKFSIGI